MNEREAHQIKLQFDLLAAKMRANLLTREEWQAEMKRLHALKQTNQPSELAHSASEPMLVNVAPKAERCGRWRI